MSEQCDWTFIATRSFRGAKSAEFDPRADHASDCFVKMHCGEVDTANLQHASPH